MHMCPRKSFRSFTSLKPKIESYKLFGYKLYLSLVGQKFFFLFKSSAHTQAHIRRKLFFPLDWSSPFRTTFLKALKECLNVETFKI